MNQLNNERGSGGIGFLGLLAVVFIALKILEHITWSWWLVTAPIWGGFILFVTLITVYFFLELATTKRIK